MTFKLRFTTEKMFAKNHCVYLFDLSVLLTVPPMLWLIDSCFLCGWSVTDVDFMIAGENRKNRFLYPLNVTVNNAQRCIWYSRTHQVLVIGGDGKYLNIVQAVGDK